MAAAVLVDPRAAIHVDARVAAEQVRTLYRQGVRVREQSEAQLFAVLSPVESAQLAALLAKLGGRPGRCPDAD